MNPQVPYAGTDIQNWSKMTKESAGFILNQSEALLKETLDTARTISNKAEKVITIILPIETSLLIYLLREIEMGHNLIAVLPLSAILCTIVIFASLVLFYINFERYTIKVPGEYPINILRSRFIDNDYSDHEQYINLVINACENNQKRLMINDVRNNKREKSNTIAMRLLFALILCPILAFVLSLGIYASCFSHVLLSTLESLWA